MPSNDNGNPKPKRVKGKHRDKMTVKIPVDPETVAQAHGSYQTLAGMYADKLRVMMGAAFEAQKEAQRHQAEAIKLAAQLTALEDHRVDVEVNVNEDDEADEAAVAG